MVCCAYLIKSVAVADGDHLDVWILHKLFNILVFQSFTWENYTYLCNIVEIKWLYTV